MLTLLGTRRDAVIIRTASHIHSSGCIWYVVVVCLEHTSIDRPLHFQPAPWILNVPEAYHALRARGPHAVVPSSSTLHDRSQCTKCRGMDARLGACLTPPCVSCFVDGGFSTGLQDRHTPEVDPCVAYYGSSHARRKCAVHNRLHHATFLGELT